MHMLLSQCCTVCTREHVYEQVCNVYHVCGMCMCEQVCAHVCLNTCAHMSECVQAQQCIHMCTWLCVAACAHTCPRACECVCIMSCKCVCTCVSVYLCECAYVCVLRKEGELLLRITLIEIRTVTTFAPLLGLLRLCAECLWSPKIPNPSWKSRVTELDMTFQGQLDSHFV